MEMIYRVTLNTWWSTHYMGSEISQGRQRYVLWPCAAQLHTGEGQGGSNRRMKHQKITLPWKRPSTPDISFFGWKNERKVIKKGGGRIHLVRRVQRFVGAVWVSHHLYPEVAGRWIFDFFHKSVCVWRGRQGCWSLLNTILFRQRGDCENNPTLVSWVDIQHFRRRIHGITAMIFFYTEREPTHGDKV